MLRSKVKAFQHHESVTEKTSVKRPMSQCLKYEINKDEKKLIGKFKMCTLYVDSHVHDGYTNLC